MLNSVKDVFSFGLILVLLSGCGAGSRDVSKKLSGGYSFHIIDANSHYIAPDHVNKETPVIPEKVVSYDFDEKHIVAKRVILKPRNLFDGDIYLVEDVGNFDYWILDVSEPKVHGPFPHDQFMEERVRKGVSEKLKDWR